MKTAEHEREMIGRENIEVVNHYQYKPYTYIGSCSHELGVASWQDLEGDFVMSLLRGALQNCHPVCLGFSSGFRVE